MSKFSELANKFVTCEVDIRGEVQCFAKLDNGHWVAVVNGSLDEIEMSTDDFNQVLAVMAEAGATVRFTNHSAA